MKFACDSCGTKYSIADERVRGRVLKIRCKKCDFVITVREDTQAAAAAVELPRLDDLAGAFDPGGGEQTTVGDLASTGDASKGGDDWYVSFDGEQEGPFSLARAVERVRAEQGTEKEAHAWRPGFLVWLPVEEVPELAHALGIGAAPKVPVRAATPTPISSRASGGAAPSVVPKDPSGPRAALSVSPAALGASRAAPAPRPALDLRKGSAPPIPAAARAPMPAPTARASGGLFGATAAAPEPVPAPSPMFDVAPPNPASSDAGGSIDLPISNEASGLVNIAQLAAAAMGKPTTGPAFINGHTGPVPKLGATGSLSPNGGMRQTGAQRIYTPQQLEALEPDPPGATASVPVVVVAGAAQGGTHPFFKWAALGALLIALGLGGGVIYLLTHRRIDTIVVTEPSRHTDDTPIFEMDPVTGKQVQVDPKVIAARHASGNAGVKKLAAKGGTPGKGDDALSGSQRALADLYKDGDDHTPHGVPAALGAHAAAGGQVSNQAIIAAVGQNKRSLSQCYERALKHDQSLKSGRVPIQVTVGMSGRVTAVSIPEEKYASSELGECFVQAVKHWNFPASDAAYSTEFPFILQGQ